MSDLRVLLRLLGLFRPYRGWMWLGILLGCVTVLANVGLMAVAGYFIASMAIAGLAGTLMNYFLPSAGIRAFAILRTGGRYAERVVTHEATFRLLTQLRVWLFRQLEPLAPARLQNHRGADLVSRIQADVDVLQHAYLRLYAPIVVAVISTLVIVGMLSLFSAAAAMLVLVLLALAGAVVPLLVHRASAAPAAGMVHSRAALRIATVDALQGMTDLHVYGAGERAAREVVAISDTLRAQQRTVTRLGGLSEGAIGLCANLAAWGAGVIAIAAVGADTLDRGLVPMLILAALASFEAVAPLPVVMQRLGEIVAAARRIFELADETPVIAPSSAASPTPVNSDIMLRDVRMRYEPGAPCALDGLDLAVGSGRRVAIVGPSGAGKSSVARVLLRFWDYQGGDISLGGHDLRAYQPHDIRDLISVLSQDTQLFNASIRDNLRIAAPEADDAALERAMRAAQLHDFVMAQPDGYATWIGEGGVRLSLGQARRLAVARVILRDAPILLLDEPTEGLDPETGRALVRSLVELMAGRTMLIITHRLNDVRDIVDEVVTIEHGRAVGDGSRA